jgi:nucleotide-binding universal stress UspA family protein
MLHRVPIHNDIQDRLLFISTGEDEDFFDAAQKFLTWAEQYTKTYLKRDKTEKYFIKNVEDPVELVMEHLKDNFGVISIVHDQTSEWKKNLVLKAPPDIVVSRSGTHPNLNKVLIPCDLSPFTLMQIRAALHAFHGRSDVDFRFVHVNDSAKAAIDKWQRIIRNFEMDPSTSLKVIKPGKELSIAEALIGEVRRGDFGSLILGRRGGLARVRRGIFGSVSERLLNQLPECSFAIVG